MRDEKYKRSAIYAAKCVTGVLISFLLSKLLHYTDYIWCLISIILVLSPDGTDAISLSVNRMKANLIGAGAGLVMLLLHPYTVVMITGAVVITIAICFFLNWKTQPVLHWQELSSLPCMKVVNTFGTRLLKGLLP